MNVWSIEYDSYVPGEEGVREALCTLGNGVFATRGAAPETSADGIHYPGTYAGGIYNRLMTEVAGREVENEDLVNLPNWLPFELRVDDESWFSVDKAEIEEFHQELDLRRGILIRRIVFGSPDGRRTRLEQRRLVHMGKGWLAALETSITPLGWSGHLEVRSALDGRIENAGVPRYSSLNSHHLVPVDQGGIDEESLFIEVETSQSHIRIGEAARLRVFEDDQRMELVLELTQEPGYAAHRLAMAVTDGSTVRVEKVVSLFTSRSPAISEPGLAARNWVGRADDFEGLLVSHARAWDQLWQRCRLDIQGPEADQRTLNLHIFHLLQTVSPHSVDLDVGVPARGLHGEAYRGHIFWDELFIFPFLDYRLPELTRALLLYRYRRLPEARWAARVEGWGGAMFPWQSGSSGREESQLLHLNPRSGEWIPDNSRLQRHIGLAVAYNVWRYYQATCDTDFMTVYGTEMLVEIARFWASRATFDPELDRYRILGVMGPDEYHDAFPDRDTPGLDDNAYTNVLAVWVMLRAREALELLSDAARVRLSERLGLGEEQLEEWDEITRKMRVPFHGDGIISQFDGYDDLEEFDWEGYRRRYGDIQRLDRILQAEDDTPNRYKASKQADVLMLFYLFSSDELADVFSRLGYTWDHDLIPRNVTYYYGRTSHGSTLSRVVHAWVMSRSDRTESWTLFNTALTSDLTDIQGGTTREGIHLGAMAGTVDLMMRCYSGLEPGPKVLRLNPDLPPELSLVEFPLLYRGCWLQVRIEKHLTTVTALSRGMPPIPVELDGQTHALAPGESARWET